MSESKNSEKHSEEHIRKIGEANKGKQLSEEARKKISKANKDKEHSEEHNRKVSEALKDKPQEKVTCPYCEKEGGKAAMHRYHFGNCKYKYKIKELI